MAEREKRRATTFRTSKGTIVNVAAPTVYVSPAFLSTEDVTNPTEMREVMREELQSRLTARLLHSLKSGVVRSIRNPILSTGTAGAWDDGWISPVCSVKYRNTIYLYYVAYGGVTNVRQIGLATSLDDGETFTKEATNPVIPRVVGTWEQEVEQAWVIFDDNLWKMWYIGFVDIINAFTGYATSLDGVTWTKYAGNPLTLPFPTTHFGSGAPCVIKVGSTYYMWMTISRTDGIIVIGLWSSTNGIEWTWVGEVLGPAPSGEWDDKFVGKASVMKLGSLYIMVYEGKQSVTNWRIGLAHSLDGVNWIRDSRAPLLDNGPNGAFDDYEIGSTCTLLTDEYLSLFYEASSAAGVRRVGLARLSLDPFVKRLHPSLLIDVNSINASGSTSADLNEIDDVDSLAVTVRATYGAGTAGIQVYLYSSPDFGSNWDTDAFTTFAPTYVASGTHQKTVIVDPAVRTLRVTVTNLDGAVAMGAVKVWITPKGV